MAAHDTEPIAKDSGRSWLSAHRASLAAVRSSLHGAEMRWSMGRLVSFAGTMVAGVLAAGGGWAVVAGALLLGLLVFAGCVRRHLQRKAMREFVDRQLTMIDEALSRCGGRVVRVRGGERPSDRTRALSAELPVVLESGPAWSLTGQERDDLDLYADPVGIFGVLNRTSTAIGAGRLSAWLDAPMLDPASIAARQRAVQWLDDHPAERIRLMAAAAELRGRDGLLERLIRAIRGSDRLGSGTEVAVLRCWGWLSAVLVLAGAAAVAKGRYGFGPAVVALILINMAIYGSRRRRLESALRHWRSVGPAARGYLGAARQGAADLPVAGEWAPIRGAFSAVASEPVLAALVRVLGWTEAGGMFHALCNIVFFYDLQVAHAILRRVLPRRDALLAGLSALADLEALCSLACFAGESRDGDSVCYPQSTTQRRLSIRRGRHPLIDPAAAVGNDIELTPESRMWIITGSNMAGKSTFLRMVAVNALLGQVGTAALADSMNFSPVRLISDLQARDNLAGHESYFLAEVRHLKRMVEPPPGDAPLLGVIDEPFRGTNSDEQVAAGVAVVEHLLRSPHFFVLATHERTLTELADGRPAANQHFQENLDAEGMTFDYRLRPGPAVTRNALRVLEREAYPAVVLERARAWIRRRSS